MTQPEAFDPFRPIEIAGRRYTPAAPRTPNFFEQRQINEQRVARLLGGAAFPGMGIEHEGGEEETRPVWMRPHDASIDDIDHDNAANWNETLFR